MANIYVAGPLFNPAERTELEQITATLEAAGHTCFLPHRDGMNIAVISKEMVAQGASVEQAQKTVLRAVFELDMHLLLEKTSVIVASLNGRVPDEGTIAEAAVAWQAGIPVVLFKTDSRIVMQGGDNPLLIGLSDFKVVGSLEELPGAVDTELTVRKDRVEQAVIRGASIALARERTPDPAQFARLLLREFA